MHATMSWLSLTFQFEWLKLDRLGFHVHVSLRVFFLHFLWKMFAERMCFFLHPRSEICMLRLFPTIERWETFEHQIDFVMSAALKASQLQSILVFNFAVIVVKWQPIPRRISMTLTTHVHEGIKIAIFQSRLMLLKRMPIKSVFKWYCFIWNQTTFVFLLKIHFIRDSVTVHKTS